jgi:hypothetical protein
LPGCSYSLASITLLYTRGTLNGYHGDIYMENIYK